MILGASHAVIGCRDFAAGEIELNRLGYEKLFVDEALPNFEGKNPLLSRPHALHRIAYFRAPAGLPIELVSYNEMAPDADVYVGVMRQNLPRAATPLGSDRLAGFSASGTEETWRVASIPALPLRAYFRESGEAQGLIGAISPVADLEQAATLWRDGLGFRLEPPMRDHAGRKCQLAKLRRPVPAWQFEILLIEARREQPLYLNTPGLNCISFISSDVEGDAARLLKNGAAATSGTFPSMVNGKRLLVSMFACDGGAFVELLQVQGTVSSSQLSEVTA